MKSPFPAVIPYLTVRQCEQALRFYEKAFGFVTSGEPVKDASGCVRHAEMRHADGMIMMGAEGSFGSTSKSPATSLIPPPMALYVYVDNVDEHFLQARKAGANIDAPPEHMFWGDRVYRARCPDGYLWTFATHTGRFTPPPE